MVYFLEKIFSVLFSGLLGICIAFQLGLEGYGRYQSYQIVCFVISSCVVFSHLNIIQRCTQHGKIVLWDKYLYISIIIFLGVFFTTNLFNLANNVQFAIGVLIMCNMVIENLFASLGLLNLISKYRLVLICVFGIVKAYFLIISAGYEYYILIFKSEVLSNFLLASFILGMELYRSKISIEINRSAKVPIAHMLNGVITQISFRLVSTVGLLNLSLDQLGLYAFFNRLFEITITLLSSIINYRINVIKKSLISFLRKHSLIVIIGLVTIGLLNHCIYLGTTAGYFSHKPLLKYYSEPYLHWVLVGLLAFVFLNSAFEKYDTLNGNGMYIFWNKVYFTFVFVLIAFIVRIDTALNIFCAYSFSFVISMILSFIMSLKYGTKYES